MIDLLVPRASSYAAHIDWLFLLILVTVGFWFLVAQGALFYLMYRFRRGASPRGQYVSGELTSEKQWIAKPHYLVIACDVVLIAATVYVWVAVKQDLPPAEARVRITAHQWAWTFQHPGPDGTLDTDDDITTVDELRLKVGAVYHYELSSRDVLHSFSVPVFRLKQDAVPGRTITGWFKPTLTGAFDIQCAEICGIGHGLMPARVVIESSEAHDAWMRQQRS